MKKEENLELAEELTSLQSQFKQKLTSTVKSKRGETVDSSKIRKELDELHFEYQQKLNVIQIERRRLMEELKKQTGEYEVEEEDAITLKKKSGETENEVYTL